VDKAFLGECRLGFFRLGCWNMLFDRLIQIVESGFAESSFEVTRRKLTLLGSRDPVTGWYHKRYDEEPITGILINKGETQLQHALGTYVVKDATFLTQDVLEEADQLKTGSKYYTVVTVGERMVGDSFSHRVCELEEKPLFPA